MAICMVESCLKLIHVLHNIETYSIGIGSKHVDAYGISSNVGYGFGTRQNMIPK